MEGKSKTVHMHNVGAKCPDRPHDPPRRISGCGSSAKPWLSDETKAHTVSFESAVRTRGLYDHHTRASALDSSGYRRQRGPRLEKVGPAPSKRVARAIELSNTHRGIKRSTCAA